MGWLLAWGAGTRAGLLPRPSAAGAQRPADGTRLAVLSPALAVTLRDLGAGDRIVARHGFDQWSEPTLPVVGDQAGIDYEALLAVDPTHVLIEWGARDLPPRLRELASARGWRVENFSTLSVADLRSSAARLHDLALGPGARWEEHALKGAMDRAWARDERDLKRAGRVLLVLSGGATIAALGPGSAHHEILTMVGGEAALREGSPYREMDAEDLQALNPGAVVLLAPAPPRTPRRARADDDAARQVVRDRLGRAAGLPIAALQSDRLALLDDPEGLLPSSSLVRFADELRGLLARWGGER